MSIITNEPFGAALWQSPRRGTLTNTFVDAGGRLSLVFTPGHNLFHMTAIKINDSAATPAVRTFDVETIGVSERDAPFDLAGCIGNTGFGELQCAWWSEDLATAPAGAPLNAIVMAMTFDTVQVDGFSLKCSNGALMQGVPYLDQSWSPGLSSDLREMKDAGVLGNNVTFGSYGAHVWPRTMDVKTLPDPATGLARYYRIHFCGIVDDTSVSTGSYKSQVSFFPYYASQFLAMDQFVASANGVTLRIEILGGTNIMKILSQADLTHANAIPSGADGYQVAIDFIGQVETTVTSFRLNFLSEDPVPMVMPTVYPGKPSASPDWTESATLRVEVREPLMTRHALMVPLSAVTCAIACVWVDADTLMFPTLNEGELHHVYFDPLAARGVQGAVDAAQLASARARTVPSRATWGPLEWKVNTYQLYAPNLQVLVQTGAVDSSGKLINLDVTAQTESVSSGTLTLVGPYLPDIDAALAGEGVIVRFKVDGNDDAMGRIVSSHMTAHPNGRVWEIGFLDPLEFHNFDIERLYVDAKAPMITLGSSEGDYVQQILDACRFTRFDNRIMRDPGVSFRQANYWELSASDQGGYGGITEDFMNAYLGHGGTVSQEIEAVVNANMGKPFTNPDGSLRIAAMIPMRLNTLNELVTRGGPGAARTNFVSVDPNGKYLPDTRYSLRGTGFDLQSGYAMVDVEGQSNTVETSTVTERATWVRQMNGKYESVTEINAIIDIPWHGGTDDYFPEFWRWGPYVEFESLDSYHGSTLADLAPKPMKFALPEDDIGGRWQFTPPGTYYSAPGVQQEWEVTTAADLRPEGWIFSPFPTWAAGVPATHELSNGFAGWCELIGAKFKIWSPAKINAVIAARIAAKPELAGYIPRVYLDAWGPAVVAVKFAAVGHLQWGSGTFSWKIGLNAVVPDESNLQVKPYKRSADSRYAPAWYPGLCVDASQASNTRMQKTNTVQNPFVVALKAAALPPDWPYPASFTAPARAGYDPGSHLATGLTLWEWLHTRSVQASYIGLADWRPGQFVAFARRPAGGRGALVEQYDIYMALEPSQVSLTAGADFSTNTRLGFIASARLDGSYVNRSPTDVNPFITVPHRA